jgi:hypothetical protein
MSINFVSTNGESFRVFRDQREEIARIEETTEGVKIIYLETGKELIVDSFDEAVQQILANG